MAAQSLQITLQPTVLRWARERASLSAGDLAGKMQVKPERVLEWERAGNITMAQSKRLAGATYTPHGYLFLSEPPEERLPIADFRTITDEPLRRPSPNLLDTVYAMQRRQEWMREELITQYEKPPLRFVGEFAVTDDPIDVAKAMRDALDMADGWAATVPNWSAALRHLRNKAEDAGILVVFNGVVGNNTHRKLDPEEFRGFALIDNYTPLILVNSADNKTEQMFTLAHELVHIFVGEPSLSSFEDMQPADNDAERFCDITAAEFLIPEIDLRAHWAEANDTENPYLFVARRFKVSPLVVAWCALEFKLISKDSFTVFYKEHKREQWRSVQEKHGGGNFWAIQQWRIGSRFASTVYCAAKEGRLTYKEAYSLTGLRGKTFEKIPQELGASS